MAFFDFMRRSSAPEAAAPAVEPTPPAAPEVRAEVPAGTLFNGLDDPALLEFIRGGTDGAYGPRTASLRNMAVLRSLALISEAMGMLPCSLMEDGPAKRVAKEMEAHKRIKLKPNGWQTPLEFKSTVQLNALVHGNGYARVIWSRDRPIQMIPMESPRVKAELGNDWQMHYEYTRKDGGTVKLAQREVFHLRDLSIDGELGMSRIKLAREALNLASQAERAAARTFAKGVMASGSIEVPQALSDRAYKRMQDSLDERHSGADNAGNFMLLEEGAKASKWAQTSADAQHKEQRDHQIEEVARAFGVPRPLLMMDETAWGSGIEQLGIFFVQYGLQRWFTAWEQALARVLLSESELERFFFKFNERALMRGTLKDQGEFFAKALGAGGHAPWYTQDEVREVSDMPASNDPAAQKLRPPTGQKAPTNEPAQTP
ncbi:phage portal protein, HK97 family [Acidovorax sp. CF316]|uniref:phage portal protein n=1 Tax=Acidovorax sp. CF316 TaxID=1144317 RepID=UPI00026BC7F3|nr:phage portal protein [Acidovorax sp. CF316]EJE49584.1 phage portal protein, HK97 family [Acidovorax sp. CF316]